MVPAPGGGAFGALEAVDHGPIAAPDIAHRHAPLAFLAAERLQLHVGDEKVAVRADREVLAGEFWQSQYGRFRAGTRIYRHVRRVENPIRPREPRRMSPEVREEQRPIVLDVETDQPLPCALITAGQRNFPGG